MKTSKNIGFDGRIFLTKEEWQTYCRRKPVRYIKKKKNAICCICGKGFICGNPFENAHIIGFDMGIIDLGLTPDFLDSDSNIQTAHKVVCNKKTQVTLQDAIKELKHIGILNLPSYLSPNILDLWTAS